MITGIGRDRGIGRSAAWLALFAVILGLWAAMLGLPGGSGMATMGGMEMPAEDRTGGMGMSGGGPDMDGGMVAPGGPDASGTSMSGDGAGAAGGMERMAMPGGGSGPVGMAMPAGGPSAMGGMAMTPPGPGTLLSMWLLMMAAMMLPVMVPTLAAYETLIARANGTRGGWLGVMAGYLAVWLGFAAVLAAAQWGLMRAGLVTGMGAAQARGLAAGILIVAGAWQFTSLKATCQGICLSPTAWFLGRWRTGAAGGARMGAGLGAVCVLCCWGYMALAFVGGAMSMVWMAGATSLMILEKLPQTGRHLRRPVGAALIAAGAAWPFI